LRILFIGDIFGRPGRNIVQEKLASLVRTHSIDLIIANGENSAAGFGITGQIAEELFELGVDVLTSGNHIWDKREIVDYFQMADGNPHSPARRLLRPANYPAELPGWGWYEGVKGDFHYAVINLQGRVFMASNDDPFRTADQLIKMTTARSSSSIFTPKLPPKKFRWAGTLTAASPPSSERIRTFQRRTTASFLMAPPISPMSE